MPSSASLSGEPGPETPPAADALPALLEALEEGAVWVDGEGVVRAANRLAADLAGLAPEQLVGQPYAQWRAALAACFEGLDPEAQSAGERGWTERLQPVNFPRRAYLLTSRAARARNGEVLGRLETLRNITEAARAAEERERLETRHAREISALEARLEQAQKFKMDLTANVTHDLRTPLASIKASVSGLLAGDVTYDPAVLRETLSVIEEETDRLQRRVQNLLSMAKMEAGETIVHRDWVDITDVVASSLESLRSVSGQREVRLEFAEDLPLVLADYDQLQIAVRNLVENAFLYSPVDKPVEVSVSASLGQLRVRVRDYGSGLMPDEFERVFEKFYRGRAARRIPGTGLGLPICRAIAEAHGGHLWVEHAPGGGVAFVLSIPLSEEAPDLDTEEQSRI